MNRIDWTFVALLALTGIEAATPASAQGIIKANVSNTKPAVSACVRDLKSAECGRYQDRLLRSELQRLGRATNLATVQDVSRRQVDALIASVG